MPFDIFYTPARQIFGIIVAIAIYFVLFLPYDVVTFMASLGILVGEQFSDLNRYIRKAIKESQEERNFFIIDLHSRHNKIIGYFK